MVFFNMSLLFFNHSDGLNLCLLLFFRYRAKIFPLLSIKNGISVQLLMLSMLDLATSAMGR